jgi:hypothetical protein
MNMAKLKGKSDEVMAIEGSVAKPPCLPLV